jgi:hypothetical protein
MRTWKPLSKNQLREIIADTEQETPSGMFHCDDDVYRLAREVEQLRSLDRLKALAALVSAELQAHKDLKGTSGKSAEWEDGFNAGLEHVKEHLFPEFAKAMKVRS